MRAALAVLFAVAPLTAQDPDARERNEPRFRFALGFAGGEFDYDTDGSGLDGDADAGMFRFQFEGTSRRGYGGGVRIEGMQSDGELFDRTAFAPAEALNGTWFGHFTWRQEAHRFAMPIRVGLLLNELHLDDDSLIDDEITYWSAGPYFEIAPEVLLTRRGSVRWSLYGEFGFGFGGTDIDIEGDPRDYDSFTSFAGVELGTRFTVAHVELGLAYVGRWQTMEESDPEFSPGGGFVALGYDASFHSLMFTMGVVF